MDYFKINYNKLENIKEIKFYKLIIFIIVILILLLLVTKNIKIYEKFECYGIYSDNILTIKIDNALSDKLNMSEYIVFKNEKSKFYIKEYNEFEILNNIVYQEIKIVTENKFYDNEIGIVEFYYGKKSIFKYIINLFK